MHERARRSCGALGGTMAGVNLDVISYPKFSRLRLRRFVPATTQVTEHDGFEWMKGRWWYEGIAFTWFGRLEETPDETGGLEILFEELPSRAAKRILYTIGLPVFPGMERARVLGCLGEPIGTDTFVDDRNTYRFLIGTSDQYEIGCTIQRDHGLIHVSIIRDDIRRRLDAA